MRELEELVAIARSLFDRGYSYGTAGNLSVRAGGRIFVTPTNSSFGSLRADGLAEIDEQGNVLSEAKPSKEWPFHLAVYRARPEAGAVVHLHSPFATAASALRDLNPEDALPAYTPYFAMRLPCLPVAAYFPPGDLRLAAEVGRCAALSPGVLLRNHGSLAAGATLAEAAALAEEIEEQARLHFLLGDRGRPLSNAEIQELRRRFR